MNNTFIHRQMKRLSRDAQKKVHAMAKTLIHVQPVKDGIKHKDKDCPCGPRTEDAIVIHNRAHAMWGLKNGERLAGDIYGSRAKARSTVLYYDGWKPVKLLVIEC